MEQKYADLQSLIFHCAGARQYFASLPDYAQEMIQDRSQAICTEEDLRHYADNLLRGDQRKQKKAAANAPRLQPPFPQGRDVYPYDSQNRS